MNSNNMFNDCDLNEMDFLGIVLEIHG